MMALDNKTDFKYIGTRPERPDGLDKVTGKARYGADAYAPGMLHGAVVRSPHAHARIVKIDASKALALDGVKAVVTRADFAQDLEGEDWNLLENTIAGDKTLYDGHAVAGVAATSALLAKDAAKLIEVEYEVLPHVTDVDAAMAEGAPVLREGAADHSVPEGLHPNVVRYTEFGRGDVDKGFAEADLVIERSFKTEAVHQGYIEPHACLAQLGTDGKGELWCCTQGHWYVRRNVRGPLGPGSHAVARHRVRDRRRLRRQDHRLHRPDCPGAEPQGGQAGETGDEPVRGAESAPARPASASMDVKIGMTKDGKLITPPLACSACRAAPSRARRWT